MLKKFGMIDSVNCELSSLWKTVTNDKKLKGNDIDLVLIKDIGDSYLYRTQIGKLIG